MDRDVADETQQQKLHRSTTFDISEVSATRNLHTGLWLSVISRASSLFASGKKGIDPFCGIFQKHIARHDLAGKIVGCPERTMDCLGD
jgi:hypothetical protein